MDKLEIKSEMINALTPVYGEREANNIAGIYLSDKSDHSQWRNDLFLLQSQMPIQYITKQAYFFDDVLYVDENVLIPRPETEELVYLTYQTLGKNFSGKILDIGTGSGCIALSLKKFMPEAEITGIDVSEESLSVAKKNSIITQRKVDLLKIDFLRDTQRTLLPIPDCIVSNPPYIALSEKSEMLPNVLDHEPHIALFCPSDPLIFYKAIAKWIKSFKSPMPYVFLEINEKSGNEVSSIFRDSGLFKQIEVHKDLQGKDRMVRCLP